MKTFGHLVVSSKTEARMLKYMRLIVIVSLCLIASGNCLAAVFVNANAAGPTHNGKTWNTAYKTIGAALTATKSGGEIWVAGGVYRECITLKTMYLRLYGGFRGNETKLTQRIIGAYPSIIDANRMGRPIEVLKNIWCTIDGFNVTQGYGDRGGGICCRTNSNVIIRNCRIENCEARDFGGGVYLDRYAKGEMSNCVIAYNTSAMGGGAVIEYHSYPKWRNILIVRNLARVSGGAIYCPYHSGADLQYCTLAYNKALANGGAAYTYQGGAVKLNYSIIAFNSAPVGGGIFGGGNSSNTYFSYCDLYANDGGNLGGAIKQPPVYLRNFSADPMFVAAMVDDYRLSIGSPCVGIGAFPNP